ncbi:nucleotidyltransferase domain-containing protein [Flavobacterium sp.]|uniref:nucleotidyltransferase domain-containing protein n=1 Tax=Flavobacterium sp. TaxID=239 RepID=UPI00262F0D83|nr:nucleotidyltransferase domain-containing protein [Flavobacterium sp.]
MYTIKKLHTHIQNFLSELEVNNFVISRVVLFGSYAKGGVHENSDIDLAIWLKNYTDQQQDFLSKISAKFYPINAKFYDANETEEEDPFVGIIEQTGKELPIENIKKTTLWT